MTVRPPSLRSQGSYDGVLPPTYYHQPRAVTIASRRPLVRNQGSFTNHGRDSLTGIRIPSNPPSIRSTHGPLMTPPTSPLPRNVSSNPPSIRSLHGQVVLPPGTPTSPHIHSNRSSVNSIVGFVWPPPESPMISRRPRSGTIYIPDQMDAVSSNEEIDKENHQARVWR